VAVHGNKNLNGIYLPVLMVLDSELVFTPFQNLTKSVSQIIVIIFQSIFALAGTESTKSLAPQLLALESEIDSFGSKVDKLMLLSDATNYLSLELEYHYTHSEIVLCTNSGDDYGYH